MFQAVRVVATLVALMLAMFAVAHGQPSAEHEPAPARRSPADIERARAGVLTESYQKELPGYEVGTGSGSARASDPRMRKKVPRDRAARVDTREQHAAPGDGGALGSLLSILMWGCLAVGLGLAAFWFATELAKYNDDAKLPPEEAEAKAAAQAHAIIDKPLGDADELAARGEFAEAIHTLLLRTLHELARSAMVRVERSHTSREILARVPLIADAREALAGLITAVELTHFGDDPAGAADYARCREQFNRFATAFRNNLAVQQRMPAAGGTALAS
ncbi:MAG: DUF4129 domain-containing protein [Myxococcota bacterium]|nr:DUF4129 domain-containing protein [Myxococcota bacterium]